MTAEAGSPGILTARLFQIQALFFLFLLWIACPLILLPIWLKPCHFHLNCRAKLLSLVTVCQSILQANFPPSVGSQTQGLAYIRPVLNSLFSWKILIYLIGFLAVFKHTFLGLGLQPSGRASHTQSPRFNHQHHIEKKKSISNILFVSYIGPFYTHVLVSYSVIGL